MIVYLLEGARDVVLGTDAPPYVADLDDDIHRSELRLLERGVTFRTLYEASALEDPRHVTQMGWLAAAGEQSRVLPQTSLKMLVVDDETVLLQFAHTRAEAHRRGQRPGS